jgi:hypothetical protein
MMKKQLVVSLCLLNLAILNDGFTLNAKANSGLALNANQPTKIAADLTTSSSAILTLQDLPPGFTAIEVESLKNQLIKEKEFKTENIFAYQKSDDKQFQVILGFTMQIPTRIDQAGFDSSLRQGDFTKAFIEGFNSSKPTQFSSPVPLSLGDNIGEISAGWVTKGKVEDIPMRGDMAIFRRGNLGVVLMTLYLDGDTPSIEIADAARKLDRRIVELNPPTKTQP